MCPRPASRPPEPPGVPGSELLRCRHPESRIRVDVTVDLAFVYCTECDRRLWWTRTRGAISAEEVRLQLSDQE